MNRTSAQPARDPTIVVVGGHPPVPVGLAGELRNRGARVFETDTAEDALYVLMRHTVDLVVAALDLPGLDAVALNTELRVRNGPPVIVLHRRLDQAQRAAWLEAGVADCVGIDEPLASMAARCAAHLRRYMARR